VGRGGCVGWGGGKVLFLVARRGMSGGVGVVVWWGGVVCGFLGWGVGWVCWWGVVDSVVSCRFIGLLLGSCLREVGGEIDSESKMI